MELNNYFMGHDFGYQGFWKFEKVGEDAHTHSPKNIFYYTKHINNHSVLVTLPLACFTELNILEIHFEQQTAESS